jgi:biofilm PGA synthesis lipoprotein PgaB
MKNVFTALLLTLLVGQPAAAAPPQEAMVLVYHGIGPERPYWVTPERLEADILYLLRGGYHPVNLQQFERYALQGAPLPPRAVLITFDDGVESLYRYALPLTRRYRVPAVAFVVGRRIGRPGHLSAMELREMHSSGLWSLESHSFDLHRFVVGERGYRAQLANRADGTSEAEHAVFIQKDIAQEAAAFRRAGLPAPTAFAFPFGQHDALSVAVLHDAYPLLFDSRPALTRPGVCPLPRIDATAAPLPRILATYATRATRGATPSAGSRVPKRPAPSAR